MRHDNVTRRGVLKATGGAAAAVVVGAGTAAASFTEGQCVVTTTSADAWIEACPPDGKTLDVPEGSTGTVAETCYHDSIQYAQVEWDSHPMSWVSTEDLDYC